MRAGYAYDGLSRSILFLADRTAMFMPVPKAANTSMKHMLAKGAPDDALDIHHRAGQFGLTKARDKNIIPGDIAKGGYRCFTIVRSPLARFASAFRNRVASRDDKYIRARIASTLGRRVDDDFTPEDLFHYVEATPTAQIDGHVCPQWSLLGLGRIEYEFIGKVETLKADILSLEKAGLLETGAHEKLERHNVSMRSDKDSHGLPADLARRVVRFYERDCEAFGYDA